MSMHSGTSATIILLNHLQMPMKTARWEDTVGSGARIMEYVTGSSGNPLAGATLDLYHNVERIYMPPMTWDEVYEMYSFLGPSEREHKASHKLVQKVFKECWEPVLGFRHIGQHARCSTCARLAKTRRDSPDLAERDSANKEYKFHLQGVSPCAGWARASPA